jgi:hypothetical protein
MAVAIRMTVRFAADPLPPSPPPPHLLRVERDPAAPRMLRLLLLHDTDSAAPPVVLGRTSPGGDNGVVPSLTRGLDGGLDAPLALGRVLRAAVVAVAVAAADVEAPSAVAAAPASSLDVTFLLTLLRVIDEPLALLDSSAVDPHMRAVLHAAVASSPPASLPPTAMMRQNVAGLVIDIASASPAPSPAGGSTTTTAAAAAAAATPPTTTTTTPLSPPPRPFALARDDLTATELTAVPLPLLVPRRHTRRRTRRSTSTPAWTSSAAR